MAVRWFDGVDDRINLALGALGQAWGPATIALLLRPENVAYNATILSLGADNPRVFRYTDTGPGASVNTGLATAYPYPNILLAANEWSLLVITKATKAAGTSSTSAVRFHRFRFSTSVVERVTAPNAQDFPVPSGGVLLGARSGPSDFWKGSLGAGAVWNVALTDAQVSELWANLRTSDWWTCSAGQPRGLWELNQASTATAVTDLSGNGADQTALVGTSVLAGQDPPGWTFDGRGPERRTAGDTVAISDSAGRIVGVARVTGDAVVVGERVTGTATHFNTYGQGVYGAAHYGQADTVTVLGAAVSLSDSVAVSDSATGVVTPGGPASLVRTVADAVTVSESLARTTTRPRALADAVTVAETVGQTGTRPRALADALTVGDAVARTTTAARTVTDSVAVTETATRISTRARPAMDTVTVGEAVVTTAAMARGAADALTVSDAVARTTTAMRAAADTVAVADFVVRTTTRARTLAEDALAVTDTAGRTVTAPRAVADALTIGETTAITLDTTVPVLNITVAPSPTTISKVAGFDTSTFSFAPDTAITAWKVKVVPATNSLENAGTTIPTTNGSQNTTGGALGAGVNQSVTIKGADLEAASAGDGDKLVKIFARDTAGNWTA